MAGINVNGIGRNPYADSYLTSAKKQKYTTSKDTFVNAVKKVEESKNSADTSNVMYPGDVTIEYPPRINNAVYQALIKPGDTVMGLNLAHGGHLTHGSPVNQSGILYNFVPYNINDDGVLDYDEIRKLAHECKPKMIVAGASANRTHRYGGECL